MSDETTTTQSAETKTKKLAPGVHALIQNPESGEVKSIDTATKKELAKELTMHADWKVLGVYKGKKLSLQERKSYSFQ